MSTRKGKNIKSITNLVYIFMIHSIIMQWQSWITSEVGAFLIVNIWIEVWKGYVCLYIHFLCFGCILLFLVDEQLSKVRLMKMVKKGLKEKKILECRTLVCWKIVANYLCLTWIIWIGANGCTTRGMEMLRPDWLLAI